MTNDEFLFWLWGPFELNEHGPFVLDAIQLEVIESHVKLVKKENPWTSGFVSWLEGVLEITQYLFPVDEDEAFEAMTYVIYERLKKEFERKAETIGVLKDRPLDIKPLPFIRPGEVLYGPIDLKKVCARLPDNVTIIPNDVTLIPTDVGVVPINPELIENLQALNNLSPNTPGASC